MIEKFELESDESILSESKKDTELVVTSLVMLALIPCLLIFLSIHKPDIQTLDDWLFYTYLLGPCSIVFGGYFVYVLYQYLTYKIYLTNKKVIFVNRSGVKFINFNEIKEWSIANYAVGIKTIDNKKINIGYIKNSEEFKNQLEAVLPGKGTNKPQMWLWFAIFFGILFAQYFMYYFGKIPAPQSKNAGVTYMKKIESKIKTNWHPPAFNRSYKVVLFFRVEADGRVKDIQVKQSSGNEEQDNIAIQALTKSSPLPELPEELSQRGFVDVQFNFDYNLHEKTK